MPLLYQSGIAGTPKTTAEALTYKGLFTYYVSRERGSANVVYCWRGGVEVGKIFSEGSFKVKKMWIEGTIGANLTMKIMQSHIICQFDPSKLITPILSGQKVNVKNCRTKGASGKR